MVTFLLVVSGLSIMKPINDSSTRDSNAVCSPILNPEYVVSNILWEITLRL